MKYIKKPEIVEVEEYKFGMEDGFSWEGYYIEAEDHYKGQSFMSEKYPRYHYTYENEIDLILQGRSVYKPYIGRDINIHINEGDYIITDEDKRFVCTKEELDKNYRKLNDIGNNKLLEWSEIIEN